jgi:hypothetical protein
VFWLNFEPLTPNKKTTTFAALTPSTPQTLPVKPKSAKAKFKPTKDKTTTLRASSRQRQNHDGHWVVVGV